MTRTWPEIARRADGVTVETPEGYYTAEVTYPSHYMESSLVTVRTMPWQEHEESLACALAEVATLRAQLASAKAASRSLLERVALASGLTDAVGCDEETVLAALNQMWLRAGELAEENERLRDVEYLRRGAKEREDALLRARGVEPCHDDEAVHWPRLLAGIANDRAKAALFDEWRAAKDREETAMQTYIGEYPEVGHEADRELGLAVWGLKAVERRMREWPNGEASHG